MTVLVREQFGIEKSSRYIGKIMSTLGVKSSFRKPWRKREDKTLNQLVNNIANRDFKNDNIYSADVKYISNVNLHGNFVYIEPILNWGSKFIVAWDIDFAQGISQTMRNLKNANMPENSIFHTDRGSQYCSGLITEFLNENKITKSLSRKANCWDNRESEYFFSILQSECLDFIKTNAMNIDEIKATIANFIHHYNYERRQKQLNWLTPYQYMVQSRVA